MNGRVRQMLPVLVGLIVLPVAINILTSDASAPSGVALIVLIVVVVALGTYVASRTTNAAGTVPQHEHPRMLHRLIDLFRERAAVAAPAQQETISEPPLEQPAPPQSGRMPLSAKKVLGTMLAAVAIPGCIIGACQDQQHRTARERARIAAEKATFPDPAHSDTWPSAVTAHDLFPLVTTALERCAQQRIGNPVNCPQRTPVEAGITWRIHGDPFDGHDAGYDHGVFHLVGVAVFSATYKLVGGTSRVDVLPARYHAKIAYSDDGLEFRDLIAVSEHVGTTKPKTDPGIGSHDIALVVKRAVERCAASTAIPMPPECPNGIASPTSDKATWRIDTDPVLNAEVAFDEHVGAYRVTGSFALSCTYRTFWGQTKYPIAGNYTAIVMVDGGAPALIRMVPDP